MKKKLLIVNHIQFGYSAGYVQYSRYLKSDFDITYLCWDYFKEVFYEEGISVYYISRNGNLIARNFRFIATIIKFLRATKYHCVFISYFRGCSIIPLFFKKNQFIHLNIRTGSVSVNPINRKIYNTVLRIESCFFKSISIISKSLGSYLKINPNALIFPLGADPMDINSKVKHKVSMIYVGTFDNRKMEDTIEGLAIFLRKNPEADIIYTIIGDGWKNEIEVIEKKIKTNHLEKYVSLKGHILPNKLKPYFEMANVGVAYIPITPYYNCQPATKIYEYLMAGIPVIATGTVENKQIINSSNGVITEDTPEGFAVGIDHLYKNISNYDTKKIKESITSYEWQNIVKNMKDKIIRKYNL